MSLAASRQFSSVQSGPTQEGQEPECPGSSAPSGCPDRPGHERFARPSIISDMMRQIHPERWLQIPKPPSPKSRPGARVIELWTRQELGKVAESQREMMSKAWCLGALRDPENRRAGGGEVLDSLRDNAGRFGAGDVNQESSKGSLDYASKKIPLSREKNATAKSPNKERRSDAHLKTSLALTSPMNEDRNESKGSKSRFQSALPSDTKIGPEKAKVHSRLAANKSSLRERNANNVYEEKRALSRDTTLQSSVDLPEWRDGGPASVSLELRDPHEELPEGETELPDNSISYAKPRANPSQPAGEDTGVVAASSKLALVSNRLLPRPGSVTAMISFTRNRGLKTVGGDERFLPKADSEIVSGNISRTAALNSDLQAKAASDVVVSRRTVATDTAEIPFEAGKKNKPKRVKRFSMKTSSSKLRPPVEEKEVSRSVGGVNRKQSGELQSRTPSKLSKQFLANGQVMMVDYRQASSVHKDAPKREEESERSKMKKALLSVFEYNLNGHRQNKIVITSRQPAKAPSNEIGIGHARVRRTRRLTTKTVAASPSVITNLWRQIDKNRQHRMKEQQSIPGRRSLPLKVRVRKEVTISQGDAAFLYPRIKAAVRKNTLRPHSPANFHASPWRPQPILELEEEEDGVNSMDESKSSSRLIDQTSPSTGRHALRTCPDDGKETRDKTVSRICHEPENTSDMKASTLDSSVQSQQRLQHFSNQRVEPVEEKTVWPIYSKKKKELPAGRKVNGGWLGDKATGGKLGDKPLNDMPDTSVYKSTMTAEIGARRTAAKRKSRKYVSHAACANNGTTAECCSANQHSGDLVSEKPSQTNLIPTDCERSGPRFDSDVSRKNGLWAGEGGRTVRNVRNSRTEGRPSVPKQKVIVEKRKKRSGLRGRKKSSITRESAVLPGNCSTDREATDDACRVDPRLATCMTQGRPQSPTGSRLPKQGVASASETHLKHPLAVARLSPVLPVQQVTAAPTEAGDKTISSLSTNSDTIASFTLAYDNFPSILLEAEKNRGSPLKRFGSSLFTRFHFHQVMNAERVGGT